MMNAKIIQSNPSRKLCSNNHISRIFLLLNTCDIFFMCSTTPPEQHSLKSFTTFSDRQKSIYTQLLLRIFQLLRTLSNVTIQHKHGRSTPLQLPATTALIQRRKILTENDSKKSDDMKPREETHTKYII